MAVLRYWAAAKEAAGVDEETYEAATLAALIAAAVAGRGDRRLAQVLARCSFLVDGQPVGLRAHGEVVLGPASVVEALPPFAGG
jgi:sulfur-carrier protein